MLSVHSCPLGRLGAKDTGGMSVYIRELARELGSNGHTVDIYTRAHESGHPKALPLGDNARLIHLEAGDGESLHKLAMYVHLPDFACHVEGFRKENRLRYDIIYSHYWLSAWVGNLLHSWWNIPHLAMFHTLGAIKNAIGIGEEESDLRIETERYLIGNCSRVIAATESEKKDIIFHYGARPEAISVIPCGVNLDMFRPVEKRIARGHIGLGKDKTALFVGRVEPLKGVDRLLMAVARLKEPRPRLLVIGGDGDTSYELELHRLCRKLGVEDMVSFAGLVEQAALPDYYSAADVCVIPSYYESFGLVALESLACGTPVISTRVGVAEAVLHRRESGYLLARNTPGLLAQRIGQVLSQQPVDDAIALRRTAAARFSWPRVGEAVVRECRRFTSRIKLW